MDNQKFKNLEYKIIQLSLKVGFSWFWVFGVSATNSKTNSNPIFTDTILCQKVRKTPDFVVKSGVFMVAEAGLEPTTSGL